MNKAIFIDKDGTLIKDIPYNVKSELIELAADAAPALRLLQDKGFLLIIISNQSGVARGYFTEKDLQPVSDTITNKLSAEGIVINGFYYCPHHTEGTIKEYAVACDCRKPKPGLILKAAKDFSVDVSQSWMIGDILNDVEAGNAAGCQTVLINNGNETEWISGEARKPNYTVMSLLEATNIIIQNT